MGAINPGPVDSRLLYQQNIHISKFIWENRTEQNLRVHNHNITLRLDALIIPYLYRAGFYGLYQLGFCRVDNALITALVERWRPETHTFHFPPGECTITLQDIEILAGICVDGHPIIRSENEDTKDVRIDRIERLLGIRPSESDVDVGGLGVKTSWLATHFSSLPPDANDVTIRCFVRAAILLLLGSQFLSDKSGTFVSIAYLPFLEDLYRCGEYSWGSAILACLYRNLCKTSLGKVTGFAGAAVLLQFWAWSRLTQTRPRDLNPEEDVVQSGYVGYTYGHRWAEKLRRRSSPDIVAHNLRHYRDHFDQMLPSQIVWEPYLLYMNDLPDYSKAGSNIWRARVPLLCLELAEFHQPDRVLRQFGMLQPIPGVPFRDDRAHQISRKGYARADWPSLHANNLALWNDRNNMVIHGVVHDGVRMVSNDYMAWYVGITRRLIWPPAFEPPPRGFRPNAGRMAIMEDLLMHSYRSFRRLESDVDIRYLERGFAQLQLDPTQAYREPPRRDEPSRCDEPPRRGASSHRDDTPEGNDDYGGGDDDYDDDDGGDEEKGEYDSPQGYYDYGGDIPSSSRHVPRHNIDASGRWEQPFTITSHQRRPRDDETSPPRIRRQRPESSSHGRHSDSGPVSRGRRVPLSWFYVRR